jgi:hypothetical protein
MEPSVSRPSSRTLALILGGAAVVASTLVVLLVLPAEFHRDPTGFGRLTGIDRLAGPEVVTVDAAPAGPNSTARYYDTGYRSDVIDISLPPDERGELEYKVRMRSGATLVYSWNVTGDEQHPEWFYYDFHGESRPATPDAKPTVMEYRQATGLKGDGSLIAPFDGIHGWYVQNQSDKPVVVHLRLSGFYELIPPGEYGNEAGIKPATATD